MKGFKAWAERYMAIFGLSTDADAEMVQAWQPVFEAAGYTSAELEAATDGLAAHGGAMTRPDHRPAIQDSVRTLRLERYVALERQEQAEQVECRLCDSSGWVSVPDLRSVTDGVWDGARLHGRLYVATVTCRCVRGERRAASYRMPELEKSQANRQRPVLLRLDDYERVNPEWFQQLRGRQKELEARRKADELARYAEKIRPVGPAVEQVVKLHKPDA